MDLRAKVNALMDREAEQFGITINASGDPIVCILRFHLSAESFLERIIMARLPRGDRVVKNASLGFQQKLHLVDALEVVSDRTVTALKHLNTLRNKLSHEREKTVSHDDIVLIGQPFGKKYSKVRREQSASVFKHAVWTFALIFQELVVQAVVLENSDLSDEDDGPVRPPVMLMP